MDVSWLFYVRFLVRVRRGRFKCPKAVTFLFIVWRLQFVFGFGFSRRGMAWSVFLRLPEGYVVFSRFVFALGLAWCFIFRPCSLDGRTDRHTVIIFFLIRIRVRPGNFECPKAVSSLSLPSPW